MSSGRLEARDAEIEPAARPVHHHAEQRDPHEHQHAGDVERHRRARERLRRDVREQPHQHDGEAETRQLVRDTRHALVGGGEQRDDAHADDGQAAYEQHLVDAAGEHLPESRQEGLHRQSLSSSPGRSCTNGRRAGRAVAEQVLIHDLACDRRRRLRAEAAVLHQHASAIVGLSAGA
jgi:hypothetical protein